MSHYFLDSSTLVKRYVPEIGTHWVRAITSRGGGHTIMVAQITQVEVVSATWRRVRDGSIAVRTARSTRLLIDRHMQGEFRVIGLTSPVITTAEDLLERYSLRAYDAVNWRRRYMPIYV